MSDFTKKKFSVPVRGKTSNLSLSDLTADELAIKEGKFRLPGQKPEDYQSLVGISPEQLNAAREKFRNVRARLLVDVKAVWQCMNEKCRLKTLGAYLRIRAPKYDGEEAVYVCPKCKGPVVRVQEQGTEGRQ